MPYVEKADRQRLDAYITAEAEDIVRRLSGKSGGSSGGQQDRDLCELYKHDLIEMAEAVIGRERGMDEPPLTPAQRLGQQLFDVAKRKGGSIRVDWLGNLNYVVTRLIQIVPRMLVTKDMRESEFTHALYLLTSSAIEQTALEIRTRRLPPNIEWVLDGLVGVLFDIKDEYKRRVDIAYEAVRIKSLGDSYDTPFRTEVVEVTSGNGNKGYQEIMMDFRGVTQKKSEDKSV